MERKRLCRIIAITLCIAAGGAGAAFFFIKTGIGIPCIFNRITGLHCPGCGNTRAVTELLKGHFAASFSFNAMCLPEILYILYVYVYAVINYVKKGFFRYASKVNPIDITALSMFLIWGIARNIAGI